MVQTAPMFMCRHVGALAVLLALSGSACLSDDGPLFAPVAAVPTSDGVGVAPAGEPPPVAAPPVTVAEQPPAPRLDAPAADALDGADAGVAAARNGDDPAPANAGLCERAAWLACDTFEGSPLEAFPTGDAWLPELAGCGTHRVDGTGPAFSGVNALRADDGAYPECMLHARVDGEPDLYVRSRIFLGAGPELLGQHLSLVELGTEASRDDPELRVGVRPAAGGPCSERPGVDLTGSGLVGGTQTECSGVSLEPERWYCLEVHLARAGQNASVSVSLDADVVLARDVVGTPAWAGSTLFVKLGRAAYGASGQGSVWHDDVVVSREPIGCDP